MEEPGWRIEPLKPICQNESKDFARSQGYYSVGRRSTSETRVVELPAAEANPSARAEKLNANV